MVQESKKNKRLNLYEESDSDQKNLEDISSCSVDYSYIIKQNMLRCVIHLANNRNNNIIRNIQQLNKNKNFLDL